MNRVTALELEIEIPISMMIIVIIDLIMHTNTFFSPLAGVSASVPNVDEYHQCMLTIKGKGMI